ncbi:hypothetical protein [Streptomyces roseifaciens]|uniref:hypothetical protein n=1 Tax=Streptomyces roseifaciens TaxID=1488406 RepID=UPI001C1F5CCB|nr:hypothetical protein [Streptomyces roseifaciens]
MVDWPTMHDAGPDGTFRKARHLLAHAAVSAFAWVDDDVGHADQAFVAQHHDSPAMLRHVDPRRGLLDDDFAALTAFARTLNPSAA